MQKTFVIHTALVALMIAFLGVLFLSTPKYSSAHGTAEEHAAESATTSKKSRSGKLKNVDASCMQTAIATREGSLSTAWSDFAGDITDALTARKSSLNDAWGNSDVATRNTAVAKAWKDWKSASKSAHDALKKARKSAWETFKKTTKDSCKVSAPKDEALGTDGSGSISL